MQSEGKLEVTHIIIPEQILAIYPKEYLEERLKLYPFQSQVTIKSFLSALARNPPGYEVETEEERKKRLRLQSNRRFDETHREARRERSKEWYQKHKAEIAERRRLKRALAKHDQPAVTVS